MVGKDRALDILEQVLAVSPGDQTGVSLLGGDTYLTRFSKNYVHQNVGERVTRLSVKLVKDQKVGIATTTDLDGESIRDVVSRAADIAAVGRPDPDFKSLPAPEPVTAVEAFAAETAAFTPDERAAAVRTVVEAASSAGCEAAGAFTTAGSEMAIANSLGARAYQMSTRADLRMVVMSNGGAGWASLASRKVSDIDPAPLARRAIDKCLSSRDAVSLEPGEYTVILEPQASAELVAYLVRLGFSALAVQEDRSFLCGRLGEQIVGDNITIWDDGNDLSGIPLAFDFEGVPKKKLSLVERGRAVNVVHDSYTAGREGTDTTGHAIPYRSYGPMALNVFMEPGDATVEDMIASTERGVLVTRFHYTNPIHPVKAMFTGMTRDGTFLVENGRVTAAVKNLRFTDSVLRALSQVEMVGSKTELVAGFLGATRVPPLKISTFAFTGGTEH